MADADTRSLQQIKRETEQTRAGLTSTVEQLKTSVSSFRSDELIWRRYQNIIRGRFIVENSDDDVLQLE